MMMNSHHLAPIFLHSVDSDYKAETTKTTQNRHKLATPWSQCNHFATCRIAAATGVENQLRLDRQLGIERIESFLNCALSQSSHHVDFRCIRFAGSVFRDRLLIAVPTKFQRQLSISNT